MSALYNELERTVLEINQQIAAVKKTAMEDPFYAHSDPQPEDVYLMKDRNGQNLLTPLLVAKAHCLNGMAMEKTRMEKK